MVAMCPAGPLFRDLKIILSQGKKQYNWASKITCHIAMRTLLILISLLYLHPVWAEELGQDIEASTASGDTVILHPNGRWEFIDTHKAIQAKAIANQYPENKVCPPGSQGGLMGIGRCILPGDKAFNRGSMIGK